MAEYDNEELIRLKGWLASNGAAAAAGILLGVALLLGWYGWHWYSARQDAQAANMYVQVEQGLATDNVTPGLVNVVKSLESDYSGTPYASAAAMALAAYYVQQSKLDPASQHLHWAMKHASEKGMQQIARVRAARVLWAQNKPQAALKLLSADHPAAFDSLYSELEGDIQAAQGNRAAAYKSYQQALKSLPENAPRQSLQQKIAANAPADAQTVNNPAATQSDTASESQ
ncbi:MAG: tetratricopeptide repeat protein [Salinisphaera sp.]|jgi:predicted negative regulator of RcsB-dependent stress response|nr:tetratricopeptide repeat protein [Salinisphaera sp.]